MRRFLTLTLAALLVGALLASCGAPQADDGRVQVVATLFPQYDFAKNIAGDRADVTLLLDFGADAHTYDPTPADILQTLAGQALCVIAQFSFTRHCAPVRMHTLRATLCVDLGFLSPDGVNKAPLRELELELSEGEISSLRALGDTLAEAFSLTPEPRAKLCRAQEVL